MPTLKMTTNIPVHASLKFADIVPGNFGPQVRLKGTFDGAEGMLFLPGKVWANLKALKSAGVVAQGDYNEEPTEPVELPLLHRDVVLTRSQPAGAKYADLVVQPNGATPPQSAPNGKRGVNIGGPLPGEYDNEPPHPAESVPHISGDPVATAMEQALRESAAMWERVMKQYPDVGYTADNVQGTASTMFIARKDLGALRKAA